MLLTFDIEDWFHILNLDEFSDKNNWNDLETRFEPILDNILQVLQENDQRGVFFILGWLAKRHPHIVNKIASMGHLIGSHSYNHELVHTLTEDEFDTDLKRSINVLGEQLGEDIKMYRAPGFSITENSKWALRVLANNGIVKDFSIFGAKRFSGGFSSKLEISRPFKIKIGEVLIEEFPLNTKSLFGLNYVYSGGGYFRLFNKSILEKMIRSDNYVMGYFHPRDFDFEQPRLTGLSPMTRFRLYVGLKSSFLKFKSTIGSVDIEDPVNFFKEVGIKNIYNIEEL